MARAKGLPKTGGRQRGTPNRRTSMLAEVLDSLGCYVPEKLVQLLPQLDPAKQADVLLEVMGYLFPKRKALELTGQDGGPIAVNNSRDQLTKILADPEAMSAAQLIAERMARDER